MVRTRTKIIRIPTRTRTEMVQTRTEMVRILTRTRTEIQDRDGQDQDQERGGQDPYQDQDRDGQDQD